MTQHRSGCTYHSCRFLRLGWPSPFGVGNSAALIRLLAIAIGVHLLFAAAASAQIVVNGSFENDYAGWTPSGDQAIFTSDPSYPPTDGSKVLVLNPLNQPLQGDTRSTLTQTVQTTPNQRYALSFDYGIVKGILDQRLRVTLEGSGILLDRVVTIIPPFSGPFYIHERMTFVANSSTTKLTFRDQSFSSAVVDSLLDNIEIVTEDSGLPSITSDPQRTAGPVGGQATFSVVATSSGALSYQWQFNGSNIPGATGSSLTLNSLTTSNAGNYRVVVTNSTGPVTSSDATLIVLPAATLLNGSFEYAETAWNFSANVAPTLNTAYSPTDGVELLHFSFGQLPNGGVVSQTFPTSPGTEYVLAFDVGAMSYVNHDQQTVLVKVVGVSNATLLSQTLSITAPGTGTTYLNSAFNFVANGTSATVSFTDTSTSTFNVDLVLDNVRINEAHSLPEITSQPQSRSVVAGSSATFTVGATSTEPLFYQWRFNGTPISGANLSSYTISNAQLSDAGTYDVVVSNSAGSVTSNPATLTVTSGTSGGFSNGSFESDFTNWTVTGNTQIVVSGNFGYTSTNGTKLAAFNAGNRTPTGVVAQTFATTAGQAYSLMFDVGAFSFVTQDTQRLQVTVQGNATLLSQTISVNAPGNGTTWLPQTLAFTADSATTTLTFRDVSLVTDNVDLTLDNVRVTTTTASGGALQFSATTFSVAENGGTATITVTRTGGSAGAVGISFATSNGTATNADYTPVNQTVTFAAGDTANKTVSIPIQNDALVEGSETVNLTLSSPTGGATVGSPATAVLTIIDDDVASAGTLQLSAATYSVAENGGSATITVTRTGGSAGAVGVSFATSNGTATGADYTTINQTVTFADGDTANKTISIPIQNDALVEGNETVNLTLSSPTGGASLGSPATAVLTITDDDSANNPVPTLTSLTPSSAAAGGAGFTLTVNGTNFVSGAVVQWNGTARTTTFVSATRLTATITAADIATAGTIPVTVVNPAPGGGTSNALSFTITSGFTLTVTRSGNGTITSNPAGIQCSGDCTETYGTGTTVTLTATPSKNFIFAGWGGDCSGTGACTVTMNANKNVTATFRNR